MRRRHIRRRGITHLSGRVRCCHLQRSLRRCEAALVWSWGGGSWRTNLHTDGAVDATMVMEVVRVVGQTTLAVVAIPVSHRHKVYHQHVTRWYYHATKQDQPAAHQKDTKVLLKSKLAYQTRQTTVTLTSDQWQPQDTLKRKCTSETGSKCKTKHHKTPTASVNQDCSSDKKILKRKLITYRAGSGPDPTLDANVIRVALQDVVVLARS